MGKKKEISNPLEAQKERVIPFRSRRRSLLATKVSYNSGVDWEYHSIHLEIKGEPVVISANEGIPSKPTTWRRIGVGRIPYAGIVVGHITLQTNEDLQEIKANPELLNILLDKLDWDKYPILRD